MCVCVCVYIISERHTQMLRLTTIIVIITRTNNQQEVKTRNKDIVRTTEIETKGDRERESLCARNARGRHREKKQSTEK